MQLVVVVGLVSVHLASDAAAEPSLAVQVWVFMGVEAALPHPMGQTAAVCFQLYVVVVAAGAEGTEGLPLQCQIQLGRVLGTDGRSTHR